MTSALAAFIHHLLAFIVFAVLMVELVVIKGELTLASARTLLRMDAVYGVAATLLIAVGLLRVFYTEKGSAYYFHNSAFIAKMVLFAIVGALSIYPTKQFLGWRKTVRQQQAPVLEDAKRRTIRTVIHAELTLLALMMLCAAMMARGVWY